MAKKSFMLHLDSLEILDELTNEQAGLLLKAFKDYHTDQELNLDPIIKMCFVPFRNQFIRDEDKYQKVVERNQNNGKKGGRPKEQDEPKLSQETQSVILKPRKADNDNDNDNDSDKVNDKVSLKVNNIEERKLKFASVLKPFILKFGQQTIRDFYSYWTEPNKSGTKFRMELEKTWDTERRLTTWADRSKQITKPATEDRFDRLKNL
jgi:hypothetical protein